ncbi:BRCT domain-containing protein [Prunus yedoensis var. nudiflora]|uniref:BRCT domain-containing protein n=1 Tax=Prunus yedoensis var. nudiflora TaxID=2094558 RepID=A0A314Z9D2_PRUYE|nr:BRCT domain-containing protein [Prunus yedoensis var. nudiflora]
MTAKHLSRLYGFIIVLMSECPLSLLLPWWLNKVTHLICYKFEGEKYELAKKIPKIKLVNHRWLEDCLRDWALLPEDDYNKSGYEMEMMEAEARDSEDEAENTIMKNLGGETCIRVLLI